MAASGFTTALLRAQYTSSSTSGATHAKPSSAQGVPHVNGVSIPLTAKAEERGLSFCNRPPLSVTEKLLSEPDGKQKQKRPDMLSDPFGLGKLCADRHFRQNFSIRSHEIGPNRAASVEALMYHLQDSSLNHARSIGFPEDGFGSTAGMRKQNLIWVLSKMQLLVEQYPSWRDIIEVDTWMCASRKNGIRRDWHVHNHHTGQTLLRATSLWVMLNKVTRKLSKIPKEVRAELEPYFVDSSVIADDYHEGQLPNGLQQLDHTNAAENYVVKGLTPGRCDIDLNQHVNNVKYISWILESTPVSILEKQELASIILEYKRECGLDSVLQSHTAVFGGRRVANGGMPTAAKYCEHLLSLESGIGIMKAQTEWRPPM